MTRACHWSWIEEYQDRIRTGSNMWTPKGCCSGPKDIHLLFIPWLGFNINAQESLRLDWSQASGEARRQSTWPPRSAKSRYMRLNLPRSITKNYPIPISISLSISKCWFNSVNSVSIERCVILQSQTPTVDQPLTQPTLSASTCSPDPLFSFFRLTRKNMPLAKNLL